MRQSHFFNAIFLSTMEKNILKEKGFLFSIRIVKLYQHLKKEYQEHVLSRQLLRSGTAIAAIVREAEHAESSKDFIHKLSIGLKEANESKYWLDLLIATDLMSQKMYESFNKDCEELLKLLTAIIKTSKFRTQR